MEKKAKIQEEQLQEKIKLINRQKDHKKIWDIKQKDLEEENLQKEVKKLQKLKLVKQNIISEFQKQQQKGQETIKHLEEKL